MPIRALLFDLDGTLADTETLHFQAFAEVLRPAGISVDRADYFARLIGYTDHDCFALLLAEHGHPATPDAIAAFTARKAAIYGAMIADCDVIYPGAAAFVRRCAERFPLIVVTGTLRHEAETILGRAQLRDLFVDIIAAEDAAHGKPAPDGFLAGLGRLGFILRPRPSIVAAECLAIEDTAAGVEAARRAGMRVLALSHTAPADALAAADLIRPSIAATDLDDVLRRLASGPPA
ncbi:MAG TPA: HAD family phosphatase [Candidatus Binataceae bacterium]|nr:HAD family phosphatase [Candidatus Binataceae bacterium]